jgi:hypothetical protein
VAFHRDPLAFLRAGQVEFDDVFTIRLLTARPTVIAAAAPGAGHLTFWTRGAGDPLARHNDM